jgi:hypothetical protein
MWLTVCRKRMHRNSSVGWRPVQFVNCATTTAARFVAVTSRESLVAIPCFITQDSPADRRELIIQDDAGELKYDTGEGWQIISISRRFRSLPKKFNALAGLAHGGILVVLEDDDIYLQHHISTHVRAMEGRL